MGVSPISAADPVVIISGEIGAKDKDNDIVPGDSEQHGHLAGI